MGATSARVPTRALVRASVRALALLACVSLTTLLSPPAAAQDPPELNFSATSYVIEESDAVTITVNISPQLSMNSSVTVQAGGTATLNTDYTLTGIDTASSTLSLPANTGEVSFTVTVIADRMTEGSENASLSLVAISGAPYSIGIDSEAALVLFDTSEDDVVVVDTDLDTAGAPRDPPPLSVAEGGTAKYTVVLTKEPGNSVMVAAAETSDAISLGGLTSGALTFTSSNWNSAQTVTVTGVVDDDNAVDEVATITHTVTSMDDDFDGAFASAVTVNVMDDDTPELSFAAASTPAEEGVNASVTMTVNIDPPLPDASTVNVTVGAASTVDSADHTTGSSLTLASGESSATLTVAIADDNIAEPSETLVIVLEAIADAPYTVDADADTHTITITSDDAATLSFSSDASLNPHASVTTVSRMDMDGNLFSGPEYTVDEGDAIQVLVTMDRAAALDIPFSITTGGEPISGFPSTATDGTDYTAANMGVMRAGEQRATFMVQTVLDAVEDPDEIFWLILNVTEENKMGQIVEVGPDPGAVKIAETDGAVVAPAELPALSEEMGDRAEYTVRLRTQPSANVVISVAADDSDAVSTIPATLTFTSSDWATVQTVTVTALQDADQDSETVTISHSPSGAAEYASASIPGVTVTVNDDDGPGVTIDANPATAARETALALDEGAMGEYTVVLRSEPTADVTVAIAPDTTGAVTVSAASLTFTSGNWSSAQTVTVTALQDADPDNETVTISHSASGAPEYTGLTLAGMAVTVNDDDEPGVVIAPDPADPLTVAGGAAASYTLALRTLPSAPVTVTAVSDMPEAATVSDALTFTSSNWSTAQTFTVTGVAEGRAEISHRAGGAPEYDGLPIASVSVVVTPAPVSAVGNPDDEVSEALIPELSRVLAEGAVGAVARRIQRIAGGAGAGGGGGVQIALGGQSSLDGLVRRYAPALAEGQLGLAELLDGSAFVLPLRHSVAGAGGAGGAAGGGRAAGGVGGADASPWLSTLTLWGSGEYRNLSDRSGGADDTLDWQGDLFSAQLGLDAQLHKDWLLGVAGSWGRGTMEYRYRGPDSGADSDGRRRDYRLTLGSVLPYLAWSPGGGVVQLWLSGGYGQGELQRELLNDQRVQSDLQQRLVAGGASVRLLQQAHSSLRLHVQGQGAWTRIDGDARHNLARQNVQANALRVSLQGQRVVRLAGGATLTPDVELGLRHDGGDGDTGAAAQLGGALRYRSPQGLQAEGGGELLAGRGSYREWGLWGLVSWSARSDGRGWSLHLRPRYGMDSRTTGAGALGGALGAAGNGQWGQWGGQWLQAGPSLNSLNALGAAPPVSAQLDLRLGYGLARGLGLLSPYSELLLGAETRRFRMGVQWRLGEQWSMDLLGERIERRNGATGGTGSDRSHSILLEGRIRH